MKKKKLTVFLSYPRCGNHYIWGKLIQQKKLQCLYDLDIVPALSVLSKKCNEDLDFLNLKCKELIDPRIFPLKYNFQYDSLIENPSRFKSITASEHLNFLYIFYSVKNKRVDSLCKKILDLQDGKNDFFIINRFAYSFYYDQKTIFNKKFKWTVENSIESLELMNKIFTKFFDIKYLLLTREANQWINSRQNHFSYDDDELKNYIKSIKSLKKSKINIQIVDCEKVINSFKLNDNIFTVINKFKIKNFNKYLKVKNQNISINNKKKIPLINFKKLFQFIFEKDFFEKQSLVYSIGSMLQNKRINFIFFPFNLIINKSYNKTFLNNSKIKKI